MQLFIWAIKREFGCVLTHNANEYLIGRNYTCELIKRRHTVLSVRRQNEMAHKRTAQKQTVGRKNRLSRLSEHFGNSRGGDLRVIGRGRIKRGTFRRAVFKIGHVDINKPLERFQGLHSLITRLIIDDRYGKLAFNTQKSFGYFIGKMRWCDKIYVMYAFLLKLYYSLCQLFF